MTTLNAVFFLRDDRASSRIAAGVHALTASHADIRVCVIDKTVEGFTPTPGSDTGAANVTVVRAPRDEPFFQSWQRITPAADEYVVQLHDDDEWRGTPTLSLAQSSAVFPAHVTMAAAESVSPMNFLFAAVRGDIWSAFTGFLQQFDTPDGTLDQPFCHLLESCWNGRDWIEDYTYLYDASDWSDESRARAKNDRLSREMGWVDLPGVVTMPATARLNALALRGYLADHRPDLAQEWKPLETAPAFRVAPLGRTPTRVRAAIASSRGTGRALARARHTLRALATTSRYDAELIAALADAASAQSRQEIDHVLGLLQARTDLSIDGHLRVWTKWIS